MPITITMELEGSLTDVTIPNKPGAENNLELEPPKPNWGATGRPAAAMDIFLNTYHGEIQFWAWSGRTAANKERPVYQSRYIRRHVWYAAIFEINHMTI
jgi:hypothetical protein